jgi:hypothetical protein
VLCSAARQTASGVGRQQWEGSRLHDLLCLNFVQQFWCGVNFDYYAWPLAAVSFCRRCFPEVLKSRYSTLVLVGVAVQEYHPLDLHKNQVLSSG